jgi:hypothetical protein
MWQCLLQLQRVTARAATAVTSTAAACEVCGRSGAATVTAAAAARVVATLLTGCAQCTPPPGNCGHRDKTQPNSFERADRQFRYNGTAAYCWSRLLLVPLLRLLPHLLGRPFLRLSLRQPHARVAQQRAQVCVCESGGGAAASAVCCRQVLRQGVCVAAGTPPRDAHLDLTMNVVSRGKALK